MSPIRFPRLVLGRLGGIVFWVPSAHSEGHLQGSSGRDPAFAVGAQAALQRAQKPALRRLPWTRGSPLSPWDAVAVAC